MTPRRIWRDVRGASAVEFGITAPIFLMMVFGIIEGGRVLWTQVALQHATEMAARCAAITNADVCDSVPIQDYAVQQAFGLNLPSSIFNVSTQACGKQVKAEYAFEILTGYFGTSSLKLSAQSCSPIYS